MSRDVVFVWDNFGPIHADRVNAVGDSFGGDRNVIGVELNSRSNEYDWVPEGGKSFQKISLSFDEKKTTPIFRFFHLLKVLVRSFGGSFFFCHYEKPLMFFSALFLRLCGQSVYVMNVSKFDDYDRNLSKELLKYILHLPYSGGISSGVRPCDYMRFLGVPKNKIKKEYNTMSIKRIRDLAGAPPAPDGMPYKDRHFTVIARLVEKKNLRTVIQAYLTYKRDFGGKRPLKIAGSGPMESDLRQMVSSYGLENDIFLLGFIQTEQVSHLLASSVALLLVSKEEQFGNVIIEANAMGVPSIVSMPCGARDELIRTTINGFVVESDNSDAVAFYMNMLDSSEVLWEKMAKKCQEFSDKSDVAMFAKAVAELIEK